MGPLLTRTSNWEIAALLSPVVTAKTLLASARRRLWSSWRHELADARREPTETAAPRSGGLLLV